MAGTITNAGLNLLVDGIGQEAALYICAYSSSGTSFQGSVLVTYDAAVAGVADIDTSGGNPSITIDSGITVDRVQLTPSASGNASGLYASDTVSYIFTNGGDLIIESYEITVTAS